MSVRRVTGIVVASPAALRTMEAAESPGVDDSVAAYWRLLDAPGASSKPDGETPPSVL